MRHVYNKVNVLILLSVYSLFFYSCKNNNELEIGSETVVNLKVSGLADGNSEDTGKASNQRAAVQRQGVLNIGDAVANEQVIQVEGGTITATLERILPAVSSSDRGNLDKKSAIDRLKPITNIEFLDNAKYTALVYDGNTLVGESNATYLRGGANNLKFSLTVGKTYTFVIVSVNSTTDFPIVTNKANLLEANVSNSSTMLLYQKKQLTVDSDPNANYVDARLRHMASRVAIRVLGDKSSSGQITALGGVDLSPIYENTNVFFSDGRSVPSTPLAGAKFNFTFPSFVTLDSVTSSNTYVGFFSNISDEGKNLTIQSITVNGQSLSNLTLTDLNIRPGYDYLLRLQFNEGATAPTGCFLPIHFQDINIDNTRDGLGYVAGQIYDIQGWTMTATEVPDEGFQIDIFDLDNAFSLEINGTNVFSSTIRQTGLADRVNNQIQFQGWGSTPIVEYTSSGDNRIYPPNVEFVAIDDATGNPARWGIESWPGGASPIYNFNGANQRAKKEPILRLVVNKLGVVSLSGRRMNLTPALPLEPIQVYNGIYQRTNSEVVSGVSTLNSQFHAVSWNMTGSNTVNFKTLHFPNESRINASAFGRKATACSTPGAYPLANPDGVVTPGSGSPE